MEQGIGALHPDITRIYIEVEEPEEGEGPAAPE